MRYDQNTVHALYKNLLSLYPRGSRDQLGQSMEQTFNDIYRARHIEAGFFGFVLRTFSETIVQIIRWNILLLIQGGPVKNAIANLRSPALISLIAVIPFMIMDL